MEATYILKANEIDVGLIKAIKELFKKEEVIITVTTKMDETEYLKSNPANEKFLKESIASESTVHFTPSEFAKNVEKLKESNG